MKICSVTGHRPGGFPWNYHEKTCPAHLNYLSYMTHRIEELITKDNYNYFIAGGAVGVDTDFAKAVEQLRDSKYPHVQLEIAVPCENQDLKWSKSDKILYHNLLDNSDIVTVLSPKYTSFCMQKRNEYMVKKSDLVLAFWNSDNKKGGTFSTINLMKRKKIRFELIILQEFMDEYK